MRLFEDTKVTKKGVDIIELASKKKGLLLTTQGRLEEQSEDSVRINVTADVKKKILELNDEKITIITNSINFLDVLINTLSNSQEYELTILELNFLINPSVISYELKNI